MRPKNKKAISSMIAYAILISIAIALAAGTYSYIKVYLPRDTPKCPEGVLVIAQDIDCRYSKVNLTLTNRGRFNVSGAYLRLAEENRSVRKQIVQEPRFLHPLPPGEDYNDLYDLENIVTRNGSYILEIEPIIILDSQDIMCQNAVRIQEIFCNTSDA
jgi:hypothetical protein